MHDIASELLLVEADLEVGGDMGRAPVVIVAQGVGIARVRHGGIDARREEAEESRKWAARAIHFLFAVAKRGM